MSDATGDLLVLMAVIAAMTILYFYTAVVGKGVYDNHNPKENEVGHDLNFSDVKLRGEYIVRRIFLCTRLRETRPGSWKEGAQEYGQ